MPGLAQSTLCARSSWFEGAVRKDLKTQCQSVSQIDLEPLEIPVQCHITPSVRVSPHSHQETANDHDHGEEADHRTRQFPGNSGTCSLIAIVRPRSTHTLAGSLACKAIGPRRRE